MAYVIGMDVGGTKTELSIFSFNSSIDYQREHTLRFPTNRQDGAETFVQNIIEQSQNLLNEANLKVDQIKAVGIGLPGTVDPEKQIQLMGNTQILNNYPIKEKLQKFFSHSQIVLANDANCFALAEALCGAGKELPENASVIGIILGTGVGGGFIYQGKMLEGQFGGFAEIGHSTLDQNGPTCYCGQRGCVEQILSGPAFEASFNSRRYSQIEKLQSAAEIFELAKIQEPIATAVLKEYKRNLANFLKQLTNLFDPHLIVLGGGMSKQDALYEGLEDAVKSIRFVPKESPLIKKHQIGDSAGIIGAAILGFQKVMENDK